MECGWGLNFSTTSLHPPWEWGRECVWAVLLLHFSLPSQYVPNPLSYLYTSHLLCDPIPALIVPQQKWHWKSMVWLLIKYCHSDTKSRFSKYFSSSPFDLIFMDNVGSNTIKATEILAKPCLEYQVLCPCFCLHTVWLFCLSKSQNDLNHLIDPNSCSLRDSRTVI